MDTWIVNGQVLLSGQLTKTDMHVRNGLICGFGTCTSTTNIVDASGCWVLPGAIDAHVHLALPVSGTVSADGVTSGTLAAACGGVTSLVDFAHQTRGNTLLQAVLDRKAEFAGKACIDYSFHGGITEVVAQSFSDMQACVENGITSFKLYMVYPAVMLGDEDILQVLKWCKTLGALPIVHAEDPDTIAQAMLQRNTANRQNAFLHYETRPEQAEAIANQKLADWCSEMDVPLYIVHLASKQGTDIVRKSKREGHSLLAETCPQYLHFTHEVYKQENGTEYICSPSLKGEDSRQALWEGIQDGTISTVATDHCPFLSSEKAWGKDDFSKTPGGLMGVETMVPYLLDAVSRGKITLDRAVRLFAQNPARIFGLSHRKGDLQIGLDADFILYNPDKESVITQENMHSATDYTVWEGLRLSGTIAQVWAKGKPVCVDGQFVGHVGEGQFIPCTLPQIDLP